MPYESDTFKEHHETRLPVLQQLIELGWQREQIICPSPDSDDVEWRVPKNPSESTTRERGGKISGWPVDIALFDDPENVGDYEHIVALVECKVPTIDAGISQLKMYLANEPHALLGIWTNGTTFTRVYKLSLPGSFRVEEASRLPKPTENFIFADDRQIKYTDMRTPTSKELRTCFSSLLGIITSRDTQSTGKEDQLNQIANLLLLKLASDRYGSCDKDAALQFQLGDNPDKTQTHINDMYTDYKAEHPLLFSATEPDTIALDKDTIQEIVMRLQMLNIAAMAPTAISMAFQVFRDATLKREAAQYYTPLRVIEAGVALMCVTYKDTIIDPACGTGGFLSAAFMDVLDSDIDEKTSVQWAHDRLFGVDRDKTNIKLTRALMVGLGDGSTNAVLGDSLREAKWKDCAKEMKGILGESKYSAVLTNPPFGKDLVINAADARTSKLEICKHTKSGKKSDSYAPTTELGIAFVERAWRILKNGGRLGIVLPETYFFSKSYQWFREWLDEHFILRGVLNVPMEAFQGFCRAKTNFYILEKRGSEHRAETPYWFKDGFVWVSNAPTIGLNKDGLDLYVVDQKGRATEQIDDKAIVDVRALLEGKETATSRYVKAEPLSSSYVAIPTFSVSRASDTLASKVAKQLQDFEVKTIGTLIDKGILIVRNGHGSPPAEVRTGDIPYIKVVDLRAGRVNPNSTNMVPEAVAQEYWRGPTSGIEAWTIATPARASKNIGQPCMILPNQEQMVFTKEVLLFSVSETAPIDPFFLFWALSLEEVQQQWKRVIFMQTNREDLGDRYRLITIPYTADAEKAKSVSADYRKYFMNLARLQNDFEHIKRSL